MPYKRKYRKGATITSLDELSKQEFVYWGDKLYHAGWFMSWQFSLIVRGITQGRVYYAEKVGNE